MPHPHRRTWTLGSLDRDLTYRLWFDPETFRWECAAVGTRSEDVEDQAAGLTGGTPGRKRSGTGGPTGLPGDGDTPDQAA